MTVGSHVLKVCSKTQSLIALSSAESELYAAIKAPAETIGVMSMMGGSGYKAVGEAWGDASAALGIIHRNGLGRARHIDTSLLWIHETAASQTFKYFKALGKDNPADLFTKYLDKEVCQHHAKTLQFHFIHGRAEEAPKLH